MDRRFYIGFSISSFQTEGYYDNQDWYYFIKKGKLPEIDNANELWIKYENLIPILKDLYVNSFRFSIDWARIYPEMGKVNYSNLKRYVNFIKELKNNNIEPFITLWHYVNPMWFYNINAWENRENISYFIEFADLIISNLSKMDVKYFISFNEPLVYIFSSYIAGLWPPFKKYKDLDDIHLVVKVLSNIHRANEEIYKISKENDVNLIYIENITNIKTPFFISFYDIIKNSISLIFPRHIDFYGINYYGSFNNMKNIIESKPSFSLKLVSDILGDMKKPIFITENGINTDDEYLRTRYLKKYMYFFLKNREKYNIKGYFIWSLMDNYEWYNGYNAHFGILNRNLSKKDSYYELKYILNKNFNIS
ncbi:beta-galactosidase [Nanobdella aerobiophila]|uniref:Beta-galactosidase n=1 Tax=Nanobdella aerobiophila TaxID=2586965 RepID=A0A915SSS1_9ARCH|nr:family 1 glycosylhydrolase [Nanobdella aerobiophila]BBL45576.1 beta-galactosidase [Nanobdella aerobiophila]